MHKILTELGFVPATSGPLWLRAGGFPEREERLSLAAGLLVASVVHGPAPHWYEKTSYPCTQTLEGIESALRWFEADRAEAPKTKPVPEWDWAGNTLEVGLFHNGVEVASITTTDQVQSLEFIELTALVTRICAALTQQEDPRIHALKAHLAYVLARYDAVSKGGADDAGLKQAREAL